MKEGSQINRREFSIASAAAAAGILAGASGFAGPLQGKKSNIKLGLYSITFLGVWYRGEALSLEEVVDRAAEYGYQGIEIDGKRPHGNPLDWPSSRCRELRSYADGKGIEIFAVAGNNDFSSPMPEFRESQIAYVKDLIRMTADLGARTVRMFLGWPGVTFNDGIAEYTAARDIWEYTHEKFTDEETWSWCREGLAECAGYAGDSGITLALQNHAPVIRDWRDMMKMIREVNSPNLKACLDAPIMVDKSEENIREAVRAAGDLQVLSHFGGEYDRDGDGKVICSKTYTRGAEFYTPFIRGMHEIGYSGYLSYELCHPLPKENGQTVGIEFAEKNARLAAEFLRGVIAATA